MINVDITVPYLGTSYDFSLDEKAKISSLIEEIVAMICAKEHWPANNSAQSLDLYYLDEKRKLNRFSTLSMEKVSSGRLLLLC